MATPQLEVPSGRLNVAPEDPGDGQFSARQDITYVKRPAHLESALSLALARRVVEEALSSLDRPVQCRLIVESEEDSVSLDLTLKVDPKATPSFRLRTPESMQEVGFVLSASPDGRGTLKLDVRYAGLPVQRALSYAHFLRALYREEGALYLTRLEPEEERFELFELPLPLDPAGKGEVEDRLRFLEALKEIGEATGTELVYPSEVDDEDLSNVNHVLKAIRSGWVALHVTDFTTPLGPEGVKNVLDMVVQEGEVARALAMTSQGERYKVFDSWVDLGPSTRYVCAARLQSSRVEMEEWLASKRGEDDSFEVRWAPEDSALVHVFYHEWPKPSLDVVHQNLKTFEEEYGMGSDEFRRAWEDGEPRARSIEAGDIWISFLDAREALEQGN